MFEMTCFNYGYMLQMEIMPHHCHLFISAPPTIAPVDIVKTLKSVCALHIFRTFPNLKSQKFLGSGLWSKGYYVGTAGSVSAETIQKYIQNQKLV